jgi:hypothetical protein
MDILKDAYPPVKIIPADSEEESARRQPKSITWQAHFTVEDEWRVVTVEELLFRLIGSGKIDKYRELENGKAKAQRIL